MQVHALRYNEDLNAKVIATIYNNQQLFSTAYNETIFESIYFHTYKTEKNIKHIFNVEDEFRDKYFAYQWH